MKQKVQTTNNGENTGEQAYSHLSQDLKNAVLIVSLVVNLVVFTAWVALQVTSAYDNQVASMLFG